MDRIELSVGLSELAEDLVKHVGCGERCSRTAQLTGFQSHWQIDACLRAASSTRLPNR